MTPSVGDTPERSGAGMSVTDTRSNPGSVHRPVTPRELKCYDCPRPGVIVAMDSPYVVYTHYRIVPPDEPMFVGRFWGRARCHACFLAAYPGTNLVDRDPRPCAVCSRLVCGRGADYEPVTVCSTACKQVAWRVRRRLSRDRFACAGCGGAFRPARADARYCTPACRQRAYRSRGHHDDEAAS